MSKADEASPVQELVGLLRQQALEIANEGHNGWGNTMADAADALERERRRTDWYRFRCEALQQAQNGMRDPERKMVCDILANCKTYVTPNAALTGAADSTTGNGAA